MATTLPPAPAVAGGSPARPRAARVLQVTLVAACLVLPFLWLFAARVGVASDGTLTYASDPPWRARGVVLADTFGSGGLRKGDLVTAVDGVPLAQWVDGPLGGRAGWTVGRRVAYQVVRGGRELTVEVRLSRYPLQAVMRSYPGGLPLVVLMWVVAAFVFLRRPNDRAARALFGIAVLTPIGITAWPMGVQVLDLVTGRLWPFVVGDAANALVWGGLLHFALVFPAPRGLVLRHPRLTPLAYALPFVLHGAYLAVTLPGAASALERLGRLVPVSLAAGHLFPLLVGVVLIHGYRTTVDPAARRRMRWVLVTFLAAATLYIGLGQLPGKLLGHPLVPWSWQPVFFLPFPLALGAAVLRYRLFDIEVIVKRSLVYGGLTAGLILLYAATVGLLSRLGAQRASLAPYVATALVAICFQPLRARLQRTVSRLVFGARDDPFEVIARLGRHLDTTTADTVLPGVVKTLAQALHLPYAAIEITGPDGMTDGASYGTPRGEPRLVPLTFQGAEVGRLMLDVGPSREPFGPADERLLGTVAHHVGITAHNVLLTMRLQRSLERLVSAREEERKRLRRDLHDGTGPTLAAQAIRLDVARRLVRTEPERAEQLLGQLRDTHQDVIADIRRLVEGLRPPSLDQLGLASALQEHARSFSLDPKDGADSGDGARPGLTVVVDAAPGIEPLPAAVEVAAYRIALEALTNAARHAHARTCTIRLRRDPDLLLEVSDDGRGLPARPRNGLGLHSMRERAAELGGTCTITSSPGGGTTLRARLPVPSA